MSDTRKIFLTGCLGQEPETNVTQNGITVMNVSLASSEYVKNADNKAHWFNLEIWGHNASYVRDYMDKGSPVFVEGIPCVQKYKKDGVDKIRHYIKVENIKSLYKKPKEG